MNGAPIVFNYAVWIAEFPEFAAVSQPLAQSYFNRATNFWNNCGWQASLPNAAGLLNLLTSHIAWLNAPRDANGNPASTGQPASPLVGRIDQASEGSVSVHADMGEATAGSPSQAWYMTTKYGAEFWYAVAAFRTARNVRGPSSAPVQPIYNWGAGRRFGGVY
jgi:Protein of unknown function (DUF4054)